MFSLLKSSKFIALIGFLTALGFTGIFAKSAKAETFSIGGYALNTNDNIRRWDGFPEVLTWVLDRADPDMNFVMEASREFPGTYRLKNQTTQGCINSHYGIDSRTNVWNPCINHDPDMAWKFRIQTDGTALIENYRSGLCLEMPNKANYGIVVMRPCNTGNSNQRWTIGNKSPIVNPPSSGFDIVQRAKAWVDRGIPYNQRGYYQGYRQDCSGLVSMAWQLMNGQSPVSAVTSTLPRYSITLSNKAQLQPGDIINNRGLGNAGHVVLFVRWVNQAQGRFIAYEENAYYGKAVQTTLTLDSTFNGFNIREYTANWITRPWYLERKR